MGLHWVWLPTNPSKESLLLYSVCKLVCYADMWKQCGRQNKLVELVPSFHLYVGSRGQTQVDNLVQQVLFFGWGLQDLTVQPWLSWNSRCKSGSLWIHEESPAFPFLVLGLKVCDAVTGGKFLLVFCFRSMRISLRFQSLLVFFWLHFVDPCEGICASLTILLLIFDVWWCYCKRDLCKKKICKWMTYICKVLGLIHNTTEKLKKFCFALSSTSNICFYDFE